MKASGRKSWLKAVAAVIFAAVGVMRVVAGDVWLGVFFLAVAAVFAGALVIGFARRGNSRGEEEPI
ncbi:MAG: hypothetical protein LBI84_01205 [Propionibacteriaceae bacterium]|jgi:hypothetical protein|nr:hypothetical protein [Propionibacteriaceae bacterium]